MANYTAAEKAAIEYTDVQEALNMAQDEYDIKSSELANKMYVELKDHFEERAGLIAAEGAGQFWWRAFGSEKSPMYEHVDPMDEKVFRALTSFNIRAKGTGLEIIAEFSANPFFSETKLWRLGRHSDDTESSCSNITWKPGTEKIVAKSFLNFFSNAIDPEQEEEIFHALCDDVFLNPLDYVVEEKA